tara:strand:+ start:151 stop:426 length:276 start_codon:yes stop_codon:yes gene_type:complete
MSNSNKLVHNYNSNLQSFGQSGFDYVTTGTINSHSYIAITVLDTAVLDVTTEAGDDLTDVSIPAGTTFYGSFSSITVDSGRILAYRLAINK